MLAYLHCTWWKRRVWKVLSKTKKATSYFNTTAPFQYAWIYWWISSLFSRNCWLFCMRRSYPQYRKWTHYQRSFGRSLVKCVGKNFFHPSNSFRILHWCRFYAQDKELDVVILQYFARIRICRRKTLRSVTRKKSYKFLHPDYFISFISIDLRYFDLQKMNIHSHSLQKKYE